MIQEIPPIKLVWFGFSSLVGSVSAGCGYLSRSTERTVPAALVACANGLIVGLFASLLASRYTECDPVWLILGAIALGWPSWLVGVVRTMTVAWSVRLQILALVNAGGVGVQAMWNQLLSGKPPMQPSPPATELDDGSSSREQS